MSDFQPGGNVTFTTKDFKHTTGSKFNSLKFLEVFLEKNRPTDDRALVVYLVELARSHFSPNVANLPGFTLEFTYEKDGEMTKFTHVFEPGSSHIKAFIRSKGETYTYTNACLFSSGLFNEVFLSNSEGKQAATLIPGNFEGLTQYCGLLDGFTQEHQTKCEESFKAWIVSNGLKNREEGLDRLIKAAAALTIKEKLLGSVKPAMSFKQILKSISGDSYEYDHQIDIATLGLIPNNADDYESESGLGQEAKDVSAIAAKIDGIVLDKSVSLSEELARNEILQNELKKEQNYKNLLQATVRSLEDELVKQMKSPPAEYHEETDIAIESDKEKFAEALAAVVKQKEEDEKNAKQGAGKGST